MEYFARDMTVLQAFAVDANGRPIPEDLVRTHLRAERAFAAVEVQQQVCAALVSPLVLCSAASLLPSNHRCPRGRAAVPDHRRRSYRPCSTKSFTGRMLTAPAGRRHK